ncbi:hypothetical protein [Sorangium sp. So ce381]|uniref:hypothetical protein n=1 Tax=Sorangium sp. So ce381 TaxID=3133307 RepID=UPI003F5B6287
MVQARHLSPSAGQPFAPPQERAPEQPMERRQRSSLPPADERQARRAASLPASEVIEDVLRQ